jgi:hypothetical protein
MIRYSLAIFPENLLLSVTGAAAAACRLLIFNPIVKLRKDV